MATRGLVRVFSFRSTSLNNFSKLSSRTFDKCTICTSLCGVVSVCGTPRLYYPVPGQCNQHTGGLQFPYLSSKIVILTVVLWVVCLVLKKQV